MILSELISLNEMHTDQNTLKPGGFFAIPFAQIERATAWGRYQQEQAIERLVKERIIEIGLYGSPPRRHAKFKEEADERIAALIESSKYAYRSKPKSKSKGKAVSKAKEPAQAKPTQTLTMAAYESWSTFYRSVYPHGLVEPFFKLKGQDKAGLKKIGLRCDEHIRGRLQQIEPSTPDQVKNFLREVLPYMDKWQREKQINPASLSGIIDTIVRQADEKNGLANDPAAIKRHQADRSAIWTSSNEVF